MLILLLTLIAPEVVLQILASVFCFAIEIGLVILTMAFSLFQGVLKLFHRS